MLRADACPGSGGRAGKVLRARGVITVFFTLLSILFLGLLFALIESARYQGARAQAANITDMAHYSAFSEYEQMLLKEFELFAVDGSYGSGDFSINRFRDRLLSYMEENADPAGDGIASLCFDPWQLSVGSCKVDDYMLMTDNGGEPFYQEAVSYMRKTSVVQAAGQLLSFRQDALDSLEKQEQYEREKMSADRELEEAGQQEEEAEQQLIRDEEAAAEAGDADGAALAAAKKEEAARRKKLNPLPALKKLARKDLLTIACGDAQISEEKVGRSSLVYSRSRKKGTWSQPSRWSGLMNDLYFREYLLSHFGDYRSVRSGTQLKYELEYILCGKRSDRDNLKGTVKKLLLLREGCNYVYCVSDEVMSSEAGALSALLIGWTGIPALTAVLKHALLLSWAYAESLLDVRKIMSGGKVPLIASEETWILTIDQLADINELLEETGTGGGEGLDYHAYLRLLLNLQSVSSQKKRGLELVELRISRGSGLSNFQADHLIVAVRGRTNWRIPPLLSRVTSAFMGLMGRETQTTAEGGFSYLYNDE